MPVPLSRAQLHAAGYSDRELRRLRRTGVLTTVRRGSYVRGAQPEEVTVRHAVAARAALERLAPGTVCSHVTAAVLLDLPVWKIPLRRVHVTRSSGRSGGRANARVHLHAAPLAADEVRLASGLPATEVARTVVDLARTVPFEEAVAVADAALRADRERAALVEPAVLSAALVRAARWPGAPAARRAVAFADGRSASVGESRSRVALARARLPAPVLQWEVRDGQGRLVGRCDFGWPHARTVGEFDGQIKYGRSLRPGQEPGEVVFAEKVREDRLRDLGLAVVRWTWDDLTDFTTVADRLRDRLHR